MASYVASAAAWSADAITRPTRVPVAQISAGDTAWMISSLVANCVAELPTRRLAPVVAHQPPVPKAIPAPAAHVLLSVPRYVGRLR
ncbi:MAG: hypothetical protein ABJD97_13925 [Betaproteobacteria bacterium]